MSSSSSMNPADRQTAGVDINSPNSQTPSSTIASLNNTTLQTSRRNSISSSFERNDPANSSFKEQKKSYHLKKKHFTKNIQSAIESTQEIHSGWLKARTTFKRWTKVWCQVKPGYLIMYTSQEAQKKHRFGVLILSVCQLIKRPTKKEGFCFKLINPFEGSVWAISSTRALVFPQSSLTLRASDVSVGKLWLDAFDRCNLSANLEGFKSIVDGTKMIGGSNGNRVEMSDTDDDGETSTRQFESILSQHSNSTSDNTSLSSRNNCRSASGKPFSNGGSSLFIGASNSNISSTPKTHNQHQNSKPLVSDGGSFSRNRMPNSVSSDQIASSHQSAKIENNISRLNNNNYDTTNKNGNSIFGDGRKFTDHNCKPPVASKLSTSETANSSLTSTKMVAKFSRYNWKELQLESVNYLGDVGAEEFGKVGAQSEEVHESNKNFLWHIIKQLRPGMDLSKVTLPTFILEPRSFLEKLADYYYHCDILSDAVLIDDPVMRLVNIVKWYLSGFYKKPKGPKKPYNPILGEKFRCFWDHPKTQSRTFFIAEQVSHHPPISAFHVTNRKDGYTITCSPLSRSKFGGNSVSAILDGKAKLFLTKRKESYTITMPNAHCRGILLGSLCLELGGKVEIECVETGCKCELDFKLASVWANSNSYNTLTGKILIQPDKVTHTLDGHWDKKINILDKRTGERSVLWEVTDKVRESRLKRYTVSMRDQGERESVKLWSKVTDALIAGDQVMATAEKTRLEDMQRQEARDRKGAFVPDNFETQTKGSNEWFFKWHDARNWDKSQDIMQFEDDFKVRTLVFDASTKTSDTSSGQPKSRTFNPIIDLPLTQLNELSGKMVAGLPGEEHNQLKGVTQQKGADDSFRTIESKLDAKNLLIEQAIKQVSERSKKLEEDIATLKRGKKTVAFVMTAIIVALLSAFFTYYS